MSRRHHLLALASLACAAPALLRSAWAQAPDERRQGDWVILRARYGTTERSVDVTQRLRELARRDERFRMGNTTFGVDPHPNRVKTLQIVARRSDGEQRTFEYAEGSIVDGSQFTGWGSGNWGGGGAGGGTDSGEFLILQARYGTAERNVDVTQRLKQLARQDREFRMGNSSFGVDPHPNRVKTLRIFARGLDGRPRTFEYAEGNVVDGSQFKGWASGQWGSGWGGGWGGSGGHAGGGGQVGPGRPQRLTLINARYGAGPRQRDVTQTLRSRIQGGRLDVLVDNGLLGGIDPAPNQPKELRLTYRLDNGRQQSLSVAEGQRLRLP